MRIFLSVLIFLPVYITGVHSDFLGPRYPSPVDLTSSNSMVTDGWRNITFILDAYVQGNGTSSGALRNLTFSIGMFSIHDPAAQSLQYHYTSKEVRNGPGTHKVDGDSIYRVASISKLMTVFAMNLELDDEQWNQPITDFVTGLSSSALEKVGDDRVSNIQWEEVSLRALAAQIAGVPNFAQPFLYDLGLIPGLNLTEFGLPPLDPDDPATFWPCLSNPELSINACTPDLFFEGTEFHAPSFEPWTSPAYANSGFILLGLALANITGKPIADVYPDTIFNPLGMANSKSKPPPQSEWYQYVVPGDDPTAQWAQPGGLSISAGGLFSSLNDLATFGTALMNSTLLSRAKTREWMKPVSHTADPTFSVGAPWEIYRYTHPITGVVTDIYTKSGDAGNYTGFAVMLPDYDAGFNVISAESNGTERSIMAQTIADTITAIIIPALEAQAAAEAMSNFAGTYKSNSPDLNSSLTVTYNDSATDPGLFITSWISNGTDMVALELLGPSPLKLQVSITEPGKIAFRALSVKPNLPSDTGLFVRMFNYNDWLAVDGLTYGGVAVDLFVFDVGLDGKATVASPAVTRAKLERVG